jgi:hypothetical protein
MAATSPASGGPPGAAAPSPGGAAAAASPSATDAAAGGCEPTPLRILTFSGSQPFVVRCERETRVKDIVAAIAAIWGFADAAKLFTLCGPPRGVTDAHDANKLLPGPLLRPNDRPCQLPSASGSPADGAASRAAPPGGDAAAAADSRAQASGPSSTNSNSAGAAAAAATTLPPLLMVRSVFGSTDPALEFNPAVLSLTAAQIAADVAARRYPVTMDAHMCEALVRQGQHTVVLHMAASWPSGGAACAPRAAARPASLVAGEPHVCARDTHTKLTRCCCCCCCCCRAVCGAVCRAAAGPCLIVGPAHVLSGGGPLGLGPDEVVNVGLNEQGIHIMTSQQHRCARARACARACVRVWLPRCSHALARCDSKAVPCAWDPRCCPCLPLLPP